MVDVAGQKAGLARRWWALPLPARLLQVAAAAVLLSSLACLVLGHALEDDARRVSEAHDRWLPVILAAYTRAGSPPGPWTVDQPVWVAASQEAPDPWGRPWCVSTTNWTFDIAAGTSYSAGPNGIDESGDGDDVFPDTVWTSRPNTARRLRNRHAPSLLVLGIILLVLASYGWVRRLLPSRNLVKEGVRALVLASPLVLPGAFVGLLFSEALGELAMLSVVPFPFAVGGTFVLAMALVIVYRRHRLLNPTIK
jgi:hypothetical protein